jgi:hypothetical protein
MIPAANFTPPSNIAPPPPNMPPPPPLSAWSGASNLMSVVVAGKTNAVGYVDSANATSATFTGPKAMCVDSVGNLYVLDNNCIRKLMPAAGAGPTGPY